ncbi:hypothetical protein REPUB_Repub11eG0101800 [Reevesia pubescens]
MEWRQTDLSDLLTIWNQWGIKEHDCFSKRYKDISFLLSIRMDKEIIEVAGQFCDPSYRCCSFNGEDLTPTLEEYSTMLRIHPSTLNRIYWKEQKKSKYWKRISKIMGIEGEELKGTMKRESCGLPWKVLKDYIARAQDQEVAIEMFALAIYGLVIFPKVLGHIEMNVIDFFGQLEKKINSIPSILAETFRTLNFCRRKEKGQFIDCL